MRTLTRATLIALVLATCSLALSATRPPRGPGVWLDYWSEGGFTGRDYIGLQVTQTGAATLSMYFPQPAEVSVQFTPAELAYARQLTAPLWCLAGQPISTTGADIPTSTLTLLQDAKEVTLTWVGTQRPELLAFTAFVRSLAYQVTLVQALRAGDVPQTLHLVRSAPDPLTHVFRQTDLTAPLWLAVERWPLAAATAQENAEILPGAVALLSELEPHGEWAGRVMEAVSLLSSDNRLLAIASLSQAAAGNQRPNVPWDYLTPLFVDAAATLAQVPVSQRSESQQRALAGAQAALRALYGTEIVLTPRSCPSVTARR